MDSDRVREGLTAVVSGVRRGRDMADDLCVACVELLDVDGAALSVIYDGALSRSYGSSSELSREIDELQFTLGEGPCLDAARSSTSVLSADLWSESEQRWPAFVEAAGQRGVRAMMALPVAVASSSIGALDLYRNRPGGLDPFTVRGGFIAAELAALPLLDLMGIDLGAAVADESSTAWNELTSLTRVEVYQAAGMLIAQLGISAAEALVRLRGYAFAHDMTASEVATAILERRLRLSDDAVVGGPGEAGELDGGQ